MAENARRNGDLERLDVDSVERETTPRLLILLRTQFISLSLYFEYCIDSRCIRRYSSAIDDSYRSSQGGVTARIGRTPDHVADETVIRRDDERYWLYAVVGTRSVPLARKSLRDFECRSRSNELLQTMLEPTGNDALAHNFVVERREKHHVDDATFLVDGVSPLHESCRQHDLDFRDERQEIAPP